MATNEEYGQGAPDDNGAGATESKRQRQRDLDQHDRMMQAKAAEAARNTLHDSTPFAEEGTYTIYEARDRAAHTPSFAEIERPTTIADDTKYVFTDKERYLFNVQRGDMAELYPQGPEARALAERARLVEVNPDGPEARQIADEARIAKLYAGVLEGDRPQDYNNQKEAAKDVTPEQEANVGKALGEIQLSDKIGGASDVGGTATPNDPTPIEKSREIGQDLQRQGLIDKDK
jgi:hypothetical protein